MKANAKYYLTALMAFSIFLCHTAIHSQSFVYLNDTLTLSLNGNTWGDIHWQHSADGLIWTNIQGATGNNVKLNPASTYYYRAKVTSGTCNPFYSDIIKIAVLTFNCGDTLIDYRDNQKYPTTQIGLQCWTAKNLNTGIMINNGTEYPSNNGIIEKNCYNNDTNKCNIYGGLYDWNEMMGYTETESIRGICPHGWHIPSDAEWIEMEMALGMSYSTASLYNTWRGTDQGTQLKAGGTSGFNALLSGISIPNGMFNAIDQYEYIYSSTPYSGYAWRRCLRTGDATVGRWNTFPKNYGMSVRCVRN